MGAYGRRSYSKLSDDSKLSSELLLPKGVVNFLSVLGNPTVPGVNLICRLQSWTQWLPFLSEGQAQRRHSFAAFLLESSLASIPSVLPKSPCRFTVVILDFLSDFLRFFLEILLGFIRPVIVLPETFKTAISLSRFDSLKHFSVLSSTWSIRWLFARSLAVAETSRWSRSCKVVSFGPWSLSMWETNSFSSPKSEANHQTHCATKICWVRLEWDITYSKAYNIMSLSCSKVTGI